MLQLYFRNIMLFRALITFICLIIINYNSKLTVMSYTAGFTKFIWCYINHLLFFQINYYTGMYVQHSQWESWSNDFGWWWCVYWWKDVWPFTNYGRNICWRFVYHCVLHITFGAPWCLIPNSNKMNHIMYMMCYVCYLPSSVLSLNCRICQVRKKSQLSTIGVFPIWKFTSNQFVMKINLILILNVNGLVHDGIHISH